MEAPALKRLTLALTFALSVVACSTQISAGDPAHGHHPPPNPATAAAPAHAMPPDTRTFVNYPEALRTHTLANMRDHLLAITEIQDHLAKGSFDKASDLAEQRLGMSSLGLHGAHEAAKHMPKGMQDAGTAMHRSASQFAIVAKDASVTGDMKAPLAALARVSQTCVACHAAYRIQ
jgi:hypothetical protein